MGDDTSQYIHCNGTQLRLTDFNLGPEQYNNAFCYVWSGGTKSQNQLLFTFLTPVTISTITLHYYSARVRGLPRLRFYAVPDNFDIWNAILVNYRFIEVSAVPPYEEPADRRSVSIDVNFNTKKVLMYKFRSDFQFALSEVEFFTCNSKDIFVVSVVTEKSTTCHYS